VHGNRLAFNFKGFHLGAGVSWKFGIVMTTATAANQQKMAPAKTEK
jgi:hypothetical protein